MTTGERFFEILSLLEQGHVISVYDKTNINDGIILGIKNDDIERYRERISSSIENLDNMEYAVLDLDCNEDI